MPPVFQNHEPKSGSISVKKRAYTVKTYKTKVNNDLPKMLFVNDESFIQMAYLN